MSKSIDWLLLVPTEIERSQLVTHFSSRLAAPIELCGFGPVVPAARTVQLIHRYNPNHVLLTGIAGCYDKRLEIGRAYSFANVGCYGVGVGSQESFQTAGEMGWAHWDEGDSPGTIADSLPLAYPDESVVSQLLTVCSVAENEYDVQNRKERFPKAMAEEMESFSVAAACKLCNVPLYVARGISNQAGDRDKTNWRIQASLKAASELAETIMGIRNE